jgi:hypothetical protein
MTPSLDWRDWFWIVLCILLTVIFSFLLINTLLVV